MPVYAYNLEQTRRDLNEVLSTIVREEPRFISCFKPGLAAVSQKYEWLEDQIGGRSVTAVSVDSGTVTASAADKAVTGNSSISLSLTRTEKLFLISSKLALILPTR